MEKAIRDYFNTNGLYANVGIRSLDIIRYIADKIQEKDSSKTEDDAIKLASDTLDKAGVKSKDNRLKALFFIGSDQAEKLAEAAIDGIADKKELHAILKITYLLISLCLVVWLLMIRP